MGKLILHIGTPKTGTTSLQQFLFKNRERLAEHDVHYPIFAVHQKLKRNRNGIFLNLYCSRRARRFLFRNTGDERENLRRLSQSLSEHDRTLLTDEGFFTPQGHILGHKQLCSRYWSTVAEVVRQAGAQDVTIVVYLRRQDDWAASQWRQQVKAGETDKLLEHFCDDPMVRCSMNYSAVLESVEAGFDGTARVVVRRYDRTTFEGGDIYHDFCAAADIPWDDRYFLPKKEGNVSLAFDAAEALRPLARMATPGTTPRVDMLIPLARQLSKQNPDPSGTTPFDEASTRLFMEPFLMGNAVVSEKYLDGEPLFSEEYGGRPVWKPNENRIAAYRMVFEEAIREHAHLKSPSDQLRSLAYGPPASIKHPVRTLADKLARSRTF